MLLLLYTVCGLVALFKARKEYVRNKYGNWSVFPAVINPLTATMCSLKPMCIEDTVALLIFAFMRIINPFEVQQPC